MKIVDDLYFYPWESYTQNNSNSIMISGPVKVLIDPGHKHLFPKLEQKMSADGLDAQDIQMIVHTHCHPDHMEAGVLFDPARVKQALHADDEAYLEELGPMFYQSMGLDMPDVRVDVHLTEGDLTLGDKTFQVYHTPGHSPGSVCLYWADQKLLITGDLIFAQGVGRTDFPGGNSRLLKESIMRMSELDVEVILPGHGPAIVGRDNVLQNYQIIQQMYFPML